jgi:hypothetical protein
MQLAFQRPTPKVRAAIASLPMCGDCELCQTRPVHQSVGLDTSPRHVGKSRPPDEEEQTEEVEDDDLDEEGAVAAFIANRSIA